MKDTMKLSYRYTPVYILSLSLIAVFAISWFQQVAQAATADLLISEYIEGSSNNKAIEIYNGTGTSVDLSAENYTLDFYFNGNTTPLSTIGLSGTLADGDVYVVVDVDSTAALINVADQISSSSFFNGDDTIILRKNGAIVDVLGQFGVDPGSQWGSGLTSTQDNTLRRIDSVCTGDTNEADAFDPTAEWVGYAQDTFDGLGSHIANCGPPVDNLPEVSSTDPANNGINVPINSDIIITFNEPVTVGANWFDITCTSSGNHSATESGASDSYTLNPDTDFVEGESCTVTVFANQVTDQDQAVDAMAADYIFSFDTIFTGNACNDPATSIHAVQGTGTQSTLVGNNVTIEGVVIGDYQDTAVELGGFFVQEEDGDTDTNPETSEGIFVYDNGFGVDVTVGDVVRISGTVAELSSNSTFLTELTTLTQITICSSGASVTPASVSLPVGDLTDWEAFEGMLINMPQTLTVSENYTLGRYGEVSLSLGRLFNPTNITNPGVDALAQQDLNDRSRIILDDYNAIQNVDPTLHPAPGLSASNTLRSGYTVNGLTAVLDQRFGLYRLQPTGTVNFDASSNPRTAVPTAVGGTLKLASFNVLNYFNGDGNGGGFPTARGADTEAEFIRQRDKIVSAITAMDADIIGLMEIENDGYGNDSAIQDLVNSLNDATAAGTYTFIDPGVTKIGTDQIAVGIIYKPASVSPAGSSAILDSSIDARFLDTKNRPVLAQTFTEISSGEELTIAVNHFKSKGSACDDVGDPNANDGQGNCNGVRTDAANALVDWLATDPTNSGDPDIMIMGDLNAYAMEDPITAIQNSGYTNLISFFNGLSAYSYVFDGQAGYLDHALATSSLTAQVAGTIEWHINADEPISLDYNTEFKSANQINNLYSSDAYRASDHDPVVIGLNLSGSTNPTATPTSTPPPPTATNTPPPPTATATNTPPPPTATSTPPPPTITPTATTPVSNMTLTVVAYKTKGKKYGDLAWSGATSTNVDVYYNNSLYTSTANDGVETVGSLGKGSGSWSFQVCEAGSTTNCTPVVSGNW